MLNVPYRNNTNLIQFNADLIEIRNKQINLESKTFGNSLLKKYLETGKPTKGVSADTILQATDYGIRAAAQKQQNK